MSLKSTCCFTLLLIFVSALLNAPEVCGQESVLESYVIVHGGTPGARSDGLDVKLTDKYFGNGTASAHIRLKTKGDSGRLFLSVYREVGPGEVTLALLVFRVEVSGYDSDRSLIYSRNLGGFKFGESQSGEWQDELNELPTSIQQLNIVFVGNYE
jgi:hypothetical protein